MNYPMWVFLLIERKFSKSHKSNCFFVFREGIKAENAKQKQAIACSCFALIYSVSLLQRLLCQHVCFFVVAYAAVRLYMLKRYLYKLTFLREKVGIVLCKGLLCLPIAGCPFFDALVVVVHQYLGFTMGNRPIYGLLDALDFAGNIAGMYFVRIRKGCGKKGFTLAVQQHRTKAVSFLCSGEAAVHESHKRIGVYMVKLFGDIRIAAVARALRAGQESLRFFYTGKGFEAGAGKADNLPLALAPCFKYTGLSAFFYGVIFFLHYSTFLRNKCLAAMPGLVIAHGSRISSSSASVR